VITLPDPSPPTPSTDSPTAYIVSMGWAQRRTLAGAVAVGMLWMGAQAAIPLVLGNTVDAGLVRDDHRDLVIGCLLITALGVASALAGMVRHRFAVSNWLLGALRTQHLVGHHVADHGLSVSSRTTTGEVVQAISTDAPRFADLMDIAARTAGAALSFVGVTIYLLRIDLAIGLFVAIGIPLLAAGSIVLVRPLQTRQARHRAAEGELTSLGADTVAGLRVLRGIGGEDQFTARYAERSQQVRRAGVGVAGLQAMLEAAQVLLPGLFLAGLTWLAAHGVVEGRLGLGDLVTVYAVTAFLRLPLEIFTQALSRWVRARVAAQRIIAVVGGAGLSDDGEEAAPAPGGALHDPSSGLTVVPGQLTGLVSAQPEAGIAITDRFARLSEGSASLGGVALDRLPADEVRRRILLSDAEPWLFSGTLRDQIDPLGGHTDEQVLAAVRTADAEDVLSGLTEGLDAPISERGRDFSGGQRQRLALARAVLLAGRSEVEVLLLVEPTSAVDAHTEARIAERLKAARGGATTVVVSASPLLLDRCDRVVLLEEGRVVAEGTHRELLHTDERYRDIVVRTEKVSQEAGR
jgi:ABC-type multidrug transport system fused ATPase/permease subunit